MALHRPTDTKQSMSLSDHRQNQAHEPTQDQARSFETIPCAAAGHDAPSRGTNTTPAVEGPGVHLGRSTSLFLVGVMGMFCLGPGASSACSDDSSSALEDAGAEYDGQAHEAGTLQDGSVRDAAPNDGGSLLVLHNGESVTITGDFGDKAVAEPLAVSYDSPNEDDNWAAGTLGGQWTVRGEPTLTDENPRTPHWQSSHKFSYDAYYPPYDTLSLDHMSPDDKLYISFWMYRDNDTLSMTTGSGNNSKFLRIYTDAEGQSGNLVVTFVCDDNGDPLNLSVTGDGLGTHPYNIDYSAPRCDAGYYSGDWFHVSSNTCLPQMQSWEHYEFYVNYPSQVGGTDTEVILWQNGVTVARASGMTINEAGQVNDRRLIRIGQVSGGRTLHYNEYLDEVYIDTTVAHIFIADKADLSWPDSPDPVHTEIQVPSYWQDGQITFTVNQGSFENGARAYVYVVRPDGRLVVGPQVEFASE